MGQIVKVYKDHYFPADMILIKSSDKKRFCYLETKNLDGETNLKQKIGDKLLGSKIHLKKPEILAQLTGKITCDDTND